MDALTFISNQVRPKQELRSTESCRPNLEQHSTGLEPQKTTKKKHYNQYNTICSNKDNNNTITHIQSAPIRKGVLCFLGLKCFIFLGVQGQVTSSLQSKKDIPF